MLCVLFFCVNLWEKEHFWDSLGRFFSHRTHRFNRTFQPTFRTHRTPPAYRYHRTFQLKVAVTFCEIGWLNVSVECCVFCSSVFFCEKKNIGESCVEFYFSRRTFLSLTELTDLTEPICALFRSHRRPLAYKIHRTLLLMKIPIRRQKAAYIQSIGVSRWLLPFPSGYSFYTSFLRLV